MSKKHRELLNSNYFNFTSDRVEIRHDLDESYGYDFY